MSKILPWILTLSILIGQLVKIPISTHGGLTLLDITVIILCFWGVFSSGLRLKKPPNWIVAFFVFIGVAFISLLFTPIYLSSIEYFISGSYIVRLFLYIFLGWLVYSDALPSIKKNTYNILFISGAVLAILGLLQLIFLPDLRFLTRYGWDPHYFRNASTFLDPNFLGSYLVLTLILWYQNFAIAKKWYLYLGVVVYIALLTTFSRGAYLGFAVGFLTLSILNKSFRLGIVTILLFLGLLIGFFSYQKLVAQPRGIDRAESAEFRLSTWKQGLKLFQTHPFLGVGFNAYRYAIREYNLGDLEFLQSHGSSTNDSSLLYVAATTGVLGLIAYLSFLVSLIFTGFKGKILVAGLAGIFSQSFFANTLFYPFILIWIILMAAIHKK